MRFYVLYCTFAHFLRFYSNIECVHRLSNKDYLLTYLVVTLHKPDKAGQVGRSQLPSASIISATHCYAAPVQVSIAAAVGCADRRIISQYTTHCSLLT